MMIGYASEYMTGYTIEYSLHGYMFEMHHIEDKFALEQTDYLFLCNGNQFVSYQIFCGVLFLYAVGVLSLCMPVIVSFYK